MSDTLRIIKPNLKKNSKKSTKKIKNNFYIFKIFHNLKIQKKLSAYHFHT